jgi:O-antigen ligase
MTLTIGLLLTRQRGISVVAIAILAILAFGLVISGSRSGSLGFVASIGMVILYAPGARNRIYVLWAVVMLSAAGFWLIQDIPTGTTSLDRFFSGSSESDSDYHASGVRIDQGRLLVWREGVEIFRDNPISGVGLMRFGDEIRTRLPESRAMGAHSGYMQVLGETGLLGIVPYGLLLVYVSYVFVRSVREESSDQHLWRVVFLAAFIGMAVNTAFGSYHFDRYFWIPIAFAGMLELRERQRRQTKADFSAPESAPVHSLAE